MDVKADPLNLKLAEDRFSVHTSSWSEYIFVDYYSWCTIGEL